MSDALARINERVQKAAQAEMVHRAEFGASLTWITLVGAKSKVLVKKDEAYIPGATVDSFVVASKKLLLGDKFKAVVLGVLKVYAEMTTPVVREEIAKTVGYWHPNDAEQVPLEGNFSRPLPNGNHLEVQHWAMLYLPDHPELEGVVLTFKGAGNQYARKLQKLLKEQSTISPELIVEFSAEQVENKKYNTYFSYPVAEVVGKAFDFDGGIKAVKGGLSAEVVEEICTRYADLYDAYDKGAMLSKHVYDGPKEIGAPETKAIADRTEVKAELVEDDGQTIPF
jgi:hypothetical protein